jgi:hypothetical protein
MLNWRLKRRPCPQGTKMRSVSKAQVANTRPILRQTAYVTKNSVKLHNTLLALNTPTGAVLPTPPTSWRKKQVECIPKRTIKFIFPICHVNLPNGKSKKDYIARNV